ncbi:hypothetical protein SKC41_22350 [Mycobacterium sp. 050128]|uniref:hypothetical protein n=1 Tax=Mycobacterium sp. 050128 TaxID=3096112 RepID=UPI002ED81E90
MRRHRITPAPAVIGYWSDAILGLQQPTLARLDYIDALRSWAEAIVDMQQGNDFRDGEPCETHRTHHRSHRVLYDGRGCLDHDAW